MAFVPTAFRVAPRQHSLTTLTTTSRPCDWATPRGQRAHVSPRVECNAEPGITQTDEKATEQPTLLRNFNTYMWRGHTINYREEGNKAGYGVILIHGFGASIQHWRKNIPALSETDALHVFAIDLLGFGASTKASPKHTIYSITLWAELVRDFATSMCGHAKWSLVGNSIGSLVALTAAEMLGPHKVRSCALMNCAAGMVSFRYSELSVVQRVVFKLFNALLFNRWVGMLLFKWIQRTENLRKVLRQVYIDEEAISDELVEILATPAGDDGACEVFLAILNGEAGETPKELLARLEWCPILVLWGEKDPWTPFEQGFHPGNEFESYHNGLILKPIPNAGHCIHDECPVVVNETVVPFLLAPRMRA